MRSMDPSTWISFEAAGVPITQGSMRSLGKGRPMIHENQTELEAWRHTIGWTARAARQPWWVMSGAKELTVVFYLPKPKSYPKRVTYPTKKHDIDKLARAVLDALKGILYDDDGQVTDLTARKRFGEPRALITVESLE
jgi:crossover junction endodeoxyribonuclease RusA